MLGGTNGKHRSSRTVVNSLSGCQHSRRKYTQHDILFICVFPFSLISIYTLLPNHLGIYCYHAQHMYHLPQLKPLRILSILTLSLVSLLLEHTLHTHVHLPHTAIHILLLPHPLSISHQPCTLSYALLLFLTDE